LWPTRGSAANLLEAFENIDNFVVDRVLIALAFEFERVVLADRNMMRQVLVLLGLSAFLFHLKRGLSVEILFFSCSRWTGFGRKE
jgi:hypothetical protein